MPVSNVCVCVCRGLTTRANCEQYLLISTIFMWLSCTARTTPPLPPPTPPSHSTHIHHTPHTLSDSCIQNPTCTHRHTHTRTQTPHDQMKRNHCSASQDLLTQTHTILLLHSLSWNHQSQPCFNILWVTCFHWHTQTHKPSVNVSSTMSFCVHVCFWHNSSQRFVTRIHPDLWNAERNPSACLLARELRRDRAVSLQQAETLAGHQPVEPKAGEVKQLTSKSWRLEGTWIARVKSSQGWRHLTRF